jgi:sec-independent protein translocase protein TatB
MLSIPHLIVIFVVALIVFGPEKLPELARNLGKVMAEFRRHTGDLRTTFEGHLREIEREGETRRIISPNTPPADASRSASVPTATAPSAPSPGTVPSNPPYAAIIATTSGELSLEPPAAPDLHPEEKPNMKSSDLGYDPYLMGTEFAPTRPEPAKPERAESETKTEPVSDGDHRLS